MMIYSKTCEYAIRALSYLASKAQGVYTMVGEVSCETGLPGPYIAKIFQSLAKSGMLDSHRGPSGGFAFKRDPQTISLGEVIQAVDENPVMQSCVMGLDQCSSENACPLHFIWGRARRQVLDKLSSCRITDIKKKIRNLDYRNTKRSCLNMTATLRTAE